MMMKSWSHKGQRRVHAKHAPISYQQLEVTLSFLPCIQVTAPQCRVPDECPPRVMSLYMACTALKPQHRPTAFELMDSIAQCIAAKQSP